MVVISEDHKHIYVEIHYPMPIGIYDMLLPLIMVSLYLNYPMIDGSSKLPSTDYQTTH